LLTGPFADEQSSGAVGQQTGNNTFVPRRLLIGNDEYVLFSGYAFKLHFPQLYVASGNQLLLYDFKLKIF